MSTESIRVSPTIKAIEDIRAGYAPKKVGFFEAVDNGTFQVNKQGELTIYPKAHLNSNNLVTLEAFFDLPKDFKHREEFKIDTPAKIKPQADGTWKFVSKGVITQGLLELQESNSNVQQSIQEPVQQSIQEPIQELTELESTHQTLSDSHPTKTQTLEAIAKKQDESRLIRAFYYNPSLDALTIQNQEGNIETYTGIDESEFLHLQQTWNDNLARSYETNEDLNQVKTKEVNISQTKEINTSKSVQEDINNIEEINQIDLSVLSAEIDAKESNFDLDDLLGNELDNYHKTSVKETQGFVKTLVAQVQKGIDKGKQWLTSFKDSLYSEPVQDKLQSFQDFLSKKTVDFGNWIAERPQAIANIKLLKTLEDKFKQGQDFAGGTEFKVGEYDLKEEDGIKSLKNADHQLLISFKKENNRLIIVEKATDLKGDKLLKNLKNATVQPTQIQNEKRQELILKIEKYLAKLKVGTQIGSWKVRKSGSEKFLNNPQGQEISSTQLNQIGIEALSKFSQQLDAGFKQQQAQVAFPVLAKILKSNQSYNYESNGTTINYNPTEKTLTFKHENQVFKGRALGQGKWEYLEGDLSEKTWQNLLTKVSPQVEQALKKQEEKHQVKQTLATLV